ncbi:MAG: phospho-sugar mutase [Clostridiales bacterium]|nr:phospho-sugar mutase [Clostridiales bacterium]
MDYQSRYESWVNNQLFDEATKEELKAISDNQKEIEERFYKDLEFGTGGLRGIIGAGTNRMNIYTVGKATQGLANYILLQGEDCAKKGVAIAYDSRNMSPEFAETTGLVMAANGIKAYVFDELRPTPELSFTVRELGCAAGVVITASHNPKEYNGYKVYWSDGGQVPYPRDNEIITEVNKITDFAAIKKMEKEEAVEKGLYITIGKELDDKYIEKVKEQSLHSEIVKKVADDFTIVYTPLHGTGNKPVRRVLSEIGFKNVFVVPEQEKPDKNFTTVSYPNPEDPKAFTLALKLAKEKNADIVVGTDPDADRVGVVVKNRDGEYIILTGNMSGSLLTDYVLKEKKAKGLLPANGALVKTIVTTEMIRPIANDYGVKVFDVLTGFKYIGEKIKEFEENGNYTYVFGFEESYGCLAGTYARDKDSVVATMLICELAAVCKSKGITLYEYLEQLYEKYGYYKEGIQSITMKGIEGSQKIQSIMTYMRDHTPKEFAGIKVEWSRDYKTKEFKNLLTGETEKDQLPVSNVLHYTLSDGSWLCVRPSGTEPKIKIYFGVKGISMSDAEDKVEVLKQAICDIIEHI